MFLNCLLKSVILKNGVGIRGKRLNKLPFLAQNVFSCSSKVAGSLIQTGRNSGSNGISVHETANEGVVLKLIAPNTVY